MNAELLDAIDDLPAGRLGRATVIRDDQIVESPVTRARLAAEAAPSALRSLHGISKRTLQDWEQGRRQPSGAAKTLLRIAERHPEVLRELGAE